MAGNQRIVAVDDVPDDTTHVFTLRELESGTEREAILVRNGGSIYAWLNYCLHFTHIALDKGSGAELRNGEIICTNHGAYFEAETGFCTHGPCEGAYLSAVEVDLEAGDVVLADDAYEFVRNGPIETDEIDLGSKSNYEF